MKYYSVNASVVKITRRSGMWATRRQAEFLAKKLAWLFGYDQLLARDELRSYGHSDNPQLYDNTVRLLSNYLFGDREADVQLRKQLTTAEYRIVAEVASYLAVDDEGSNAPDAYLAIDLNTGRNLVLRPR